MASNNVCAQNGDVLTNDSNQNLSSKCKCQIAFQQHINVKQFLCEFWCSGLHIPKEATVVTDSKFLSFFTTGFVMGASNFFFWSV